MDHQTCLMIFNGSSDILKKSSDISVLSIYKKVFSWLDKLSDHLEQIIRHFAESMGDVLMAFGEHCTGIGYCYKKSLMATWVEYGVKLHGWTKVLFERGKYMTQLSQGWWLLISWCWGGARTSATLMDLRHWVDNQECPYIMYQTSVR